MQNVIPYLQIFLEHFEHVNGTEFDRETDTPKPASFDKKNHKMWQNNRFHPSKINALVLQKFDKVSKDRVMATESVFQTVIPQKTNAGTLYRVIALFFKYILLFRTRL